jgi:hypothetical protein
MEQIVQKYFFLSNQFVLLLQESEALEMKQQTSLFLSQG